MSKPKPAESDWELRQRLIATLTLRSQRSLERIPRAPHWPRRDAGVRTSRLWVPVDAQSSTKWRKALAARALDRSMQVPQFGDSLGSAESMRDVSREFWGTQTTLLQHPDPEQLLSSAEVRFSPRPISGSGGSWVATEMGRRTPRAPSSPRPGRRLTSMSPRSAGAKPPPGAQKPSTVSPRSATALMRGESIVRAIIPFHAPAPLGR